MSGLTDNRIRFREHRGSLHASMKTLVRLPPTMEALRNHIKKNIGPLSDPETLIVEPYNLEPDDRIGWEATYIVKDRHGVIGFMDDMPEDA